MRLIILILVMLLTACSASQNLSVYSLSDDELKGVLSQQLSKFDRQLSVFGVPMTFTVDNIDVQIGPDQRNVIQLDIAAQTLVSALVIEYPIDMQLAVEGSPRFDSAEDAVYLDQVKLINASIDAGGYKGNITPLSGQTMAVVNQFLKENPVYTLDKSDPKLALLSNIPLNLVISEGQLRLTPTL